MEPFDNSTVSQLEELKRQEPGRELPASQSITAAKATNEKFVSTITYSRNVNSVKNIR